MRSKLFETTRAVKARGQFVSERLVVDEAVVAGGADGLFIKTLGVEFSALEAGDLGACEGSAVREILGAILRPQIELPVVGGSMPQDALDVCRRVPNPSMRREIALHRTRIPPSRIAAVVTTAAVAPSMPRRRPTNNHRKRTVLAACESSTSSRAARMPDRQARRRSNASSSNWPSCECAESSRHAAQHPDQPNLRHHDVDHQRKLRLLGEPQAVLDFALRFCKRIARRKEIRIQSWRN